MLILVDGYNVTMNDPALAGRSKEAQRDALVHVLCARVASLHGRGARAVVVFDAHESWGRSSEAAGPVKSVFATVADDEIVRRCGAAHGAVVLYTDDMRLRARISQDIGRRVEYRGVSALYLDSARQAGARRRAGAGPDDELPADAKDITAELAEEWLAEEE